MHSTAVHRAINRLSGLHVFLNIHSEVAVFLLSSAHNHFSSLLFITFFFVCRVISMCEQSSTSNERKKKYRKKNNKISIKMTSAPLFQPLGIFNQSNSFAWDNIFDKSNRNGFVIILYVCWDSCVCLSSTLARHPILIWAFNSALQHPLNGKIVEKISLSLVMTYESDTESSIHITSSATS